MKNVAIAKITDPAAVTIKAATAGDTYQAGSIYVECPELGFEFPDLLFCRYGLSIPYFRVQEGDKVLIEPTITNNERWFYTGLVDCGGSITPATADQMILQFLSQVIYASTAGTLHLSNKTASQAFVKGTELKTWSEAVDASLKKLFDWAQTGIAPAGGSVDVGGIAPLVTAPTDYTDFPVGALSLKIFGE